MKEMKEKKVFNTCFKNKVLKISFSLRLGLGLQTLKFRNNIKWENNFLFS